MATTNPLIAGAFLPLSHLPDDDFGESIRGFTTPEDLESLKGFYRNVPDRLGPISGFTNYTAQEMRIVALWKEKVAKTYQLYGFTPIDVRPVEYSCNLQTAGGVEKQIYAVSRLQDGSLTKLGIPFDRTVPLALFIAQRFNETVFPYARYDIGWAFRGEKATAGRYRAFIQCDVDIIDRVMTPGSDAQCIVAIVKTLQELGVRECNVFLNHIALARAFLKSEGIPEDKYKDALRAIDKLKPEDDSAAIQDLIENVSLSRNAARRLLDKMGYRGPLSDYSLPEDMQGDREAIEGIDHLRQIEAIATLMGVKKGALQLTPNLARGLNYYTGVVFETFIPGKERLGSVASGGRYDDLIGDFKQGISLKGVGGSIGLTRLFDVMKQLNLVDLSKQTTSQVLVGYRTPVEFPLAIQVATALRELGIYTELYTAEIKEKGLMAKQLDLANKKGIPYSVIVARNEFAKEGCEILWKNMAKSEQKTFSDLETLKHYARNLKTHGKFEQSTLPQQEEESKS